MSAVWKFTQVCKIMQSLFQLMDNFPMMLNSREVKELTCEFGTTNHGCH